MLVHGTNANNLDSILKSGGILCPEMTGQTNWEKYPAHPQMVYVTEGYGFRFARTSLARQETYDRGVVIELDEDAIAAEQRYPDEDFLAAVLARQQNVGMDHPGLMQDAKERVLANQLLWLKSLEYLGTMAVLRCIPAEAITRYVVIDWEKRLDFELVALDVVTSIEAYSRLKRYYEGITAWLFGDAERFMSTSESMGFNVGDLPDELEGFGKLPESLFRREGITVHN